MLDELHDLPHEAANEIVTRAFSWKQWTRRERAVASFQRFKDDLDKRCCVGGIYCHDPGSDGEDVATVLGVEDIASAEERALLAEFEPAAPVAGKAAADPVQRALTDCWKAVGRRS